MDVSIPAVKLLYDIFKDAIQGAYGSIRSSGGIEEAIQSHISEIDAWSLYLESSGLASAVPTDETSIEIDVTKQPRRFRYNVEAKQTMFLSEDNIINSPSNYLIIGDPGAGKTTIVKRMVRKMLWSHPGEYNYSIPIVFRARDIVSYKEQDLFGFLLDTFGLKSNQQSTKRSEDTRSAEIISFFAEKFNAAKVLLFVDGLDEVDRRAYERIVFQIASLSKYLTGSKIVATSRAGASLLNIQGFDVIEIQPLTYENIVEICKLSCNHPIDFQKELDKKSYKDMSNRPLILINLIYIFNEMSELPEYSSDVYRILMNLLIEKWDRQRGINRTTSYGMKTPERKIDILSIIAYELANSGKLKFFSYELDNIFIKIREKVNFEEAERISILEEIESHSGIIIQSSQGTFEFSHLSIQEYLTGNYLLRRPLFSEAFMRFDRLASSFAMSIASSSEPTEYFSEVIFHIDRFFPGGFQSTHFSRFIRRLQVEGIYFIASDNLAGAMMLIHSRFDASKSDNDAFLAAFIKDYLHELYLQVAQFAQRYNLQQDSYGVVKMSLKEELKDIYFSNPQTIHISQSFYDDYISPEKIQE